MNYAILRVLCADRGEKFCEVTEGVLQIELARAAFAKIRRVFQVGFVAQSSLS
jgi:hypothetical protein